MSAETLASAIALYIQYLRATGHPATTVAVSRSCLHIFSLFTGPVGVKGAAALAIPFLAERAENCRRNTHVATFNRLKAFFVFSVRQGYLKVNPLADMKRPRDEKIVTQPLSDREIVVLYNAASQWQKAAILLLLGSGMRVGELAALRWQDVRDGQVLVHGKGGKQRTLAPGRTAMAALYQMPRTADTVFGLKCQSIKVSFHRLSQRTGIVSHPHVFRHSFAHRLLEAGVSIEDLSTLLGHARLETTMIYVGAFRRERALEAMRQCNPADALFQKAQRLRRGAAPTAKAAVHLFSPAVTE